MTAEALTLQAVGGPTLVLGVGGLRLITDPTFDPPGSYETGRGFLLTKTEGPALSPEEVGVVDAALVSHEHHFDNLDRLGRAYLSRIPRVVTPPGGAARVGETALGLRPWESTELPRGRGEALRITAVPALHGPGGTVDPGGEVTGFVLSGEGLPTVYLSGDNASLQVVEEVAGRLGRPDVAILHAGAAKVPPFGDALLTLSSQQAVEAARLLGARWVVGVHLRGWEHLVGGCRGSPESLRRGSAARPASGSGTGRDDRRRRPGRGRPPRAACPLPPRDARSRCRRARRPLCERRHPRVPVHGAGQAPALRGTRGGPRGLPRGLGR